MIQFFRNFDVDTNSFLLGLAAGFLLWWLQGAIRPLLKTGWKYFLAQFDMAREGLTTGTEIRLANDTLRRIQSLHIAAPLFSLDEICITPKVLAPPPCTEPGEESPLLDISTHSIPYTPEWPDLAGIFGATSLTLPEALQAGANLLLLGKPGSGKTVALANLASVIARSDPAALDLVNMVPVYLHIYDIDPTIDEERDCMEALIEAASIHASTLTTRQLPGLLKSACNIGRALLIIDGLDELTPELMNPYLTFIRNLFEEYPAIRMVVAASTEYYGDLLTLGLIPVPMAGWTKPQRMAFIRQWENLWRKNVNPGIWLPEEIYSADGQELLGEIDPRIDPLLINGWLANDHVSLNPLEITLKVWASYAGDMLGKSGVAAIEAYLLRMANGIPNARAALEQLALKFTFDQIPIIHRNEIDSLTITSDPGEEEFSEIDLEEEGEEDHHGETSSQFSLRRVLSRLLNAGLLIDKGGARITFVHPVILGYLSGCALKNSPSKDGFLNQPKWIGKSLTLQYMAAFGDASSMAVKLFEESKDPLQEELLTAGTWLRNAPKTESWRSLVMRRLAKVIQNEKYSLSLRGRALAALATSGEEDVATLFRHLMNSESPYIRQLAVLGSGYIKDLEALGELAGKLYDSHPNVCRAACLALVNIGTDAALEHVASGLLHGNDNLRKAAAEAFANDPEEGYPLLIDGSNIDDLLVRRAVVFGLHRIGEDWAVKLLEKMQLEDEQWVVRTAATEVLEEMTKTNSYIPRPLPPIYEAPWMVAFAGDRGMGITQGKPSREMLKLALKDGKIEERLAALPYLIHEPTTEMILESYHLLYGGDDELSSAVYDSLWLLNASGIELPSTVQYGFN